MDGSTTNYEISFYKWSEYIQLGALLPHRNFSYISGCIPEQQTWTMVWSDIIRMGFGWHASFSICLCFIVYGRFSAWTSICLYWQGILSAMLVTEVDACQLSDMIAWSCIYYYFALTFGWIYPLWIYWVPMPHYFDSLMNLPLLNHQTNSSCIK